MKMLNFTAAALGCIMLGASASSVAWTVDNDFDNLSNGSHCGSFWVSPYEDSKVSSEQGSSGTKSCRMDVAQGSTGWGSGFQFPNQLQKGGEFWMRFRLWMPTDFDYGVYSSGDKLKFIGIDTKDSQGTPAIWYWEWTRENGGEPPYGAIMSNDNCTDYHDCWQFFGANNQKPQRGTWETYEVYVKYDNVPADQGGTGRIRTWKNGVLVGELTRRPTLNNASDTVDAARIFSYWNGGSPKTQHMYLDDFIATNVTPSGRDASGNPYIGTGNYVAIAPPLPPGNIQ